MGKQWLPEITDRFVVQQEYSIKRGALEGREPPQSVREFYPWYSITTAGTVIGPVGKELKYLSKADNKAPYVKICIRKAWPKGDRKAYKEYNVIKLMKEYFGSHIHWYGETRSVANKDKEYIVIPHNDDWSNVALKNLIYVDKKQYRYEKTVEQKIEFLLRVRDLQMSCEELARLFDVSISWVNRIRTRLEEQGYGDQQLAKTGINISYENRPIYKALLLCNGQKSNLVLAKEIWPQENFSDEADQDSLIDKIVRVRKRLADKWIIQRYNTYGKKINIADVKESLVFALEDNLKLPKQQRRTHAEIATVLWLDKSQVDNFSRSLKRRSWTEELQVS